MLSSFETFFFIDVDVDSELVSRELEKIILNNEETDYVSLKYVEFVRVLQSINELYNAVRSYMGIYVHHT